MELQIKVTVGFLNWLGENFNKKKYFTYTAF